MNSSLSRYTNTIIAVLLIVILFYIIDLTPKNTAVNINYYYAIEFCLLRPPTDTDRIIIEY